MTTIEECDLCFRPKKRKPGRPSIASVEVCHCVGQRKNANTRPEEDQRRDQNLKYGYGMSLEEYESRLDLQGGVCAICSSPPGKRRLAVDHCHDTGLIRGLLCARCNLGIGYFKDNPTIMRMAIRYVER